MVATVTLKKKRTAFKLPLKRNFDKKVLLWENSNDGISGRSRSSPCWGRQPFRRGPNVYDFAKFLPKLHKIERIWTPRGPKFVYVDPPLGMSILTCVYFGWEVNRQGSLPVSLSVINRQHATTSLLCAVSLIITEGCDIKDQRPRRL